MAWNKLTYKGASLHSYDEHFEQQYEPKTSETHRNRFGTDPTKLLRNKTVSNFDRKKSKFRS